MLVTRFITKSMQIMSLEECFRKNKYKYYFLETTDSTMKEIKTRLKNNNLIVRANEQKKGRGRRGSKWISLPGNIYCSFAINTSLPINDFFIYSIFMSIVIKDSLEHIGMKHINFKWPNDVYYQDKKISGMILESFNDKNGRKFVIIGVGINFISSPNIDNYKTTNVSTYVKTINVNEYYKIFINYFFYYINKNIILNNNYFIAKYKKSLMFLGKKIKIKVNNKKILKGIFNGINKDGSLLLQQKDKFIQLYSGQILI